MILSDIREYLQNRQRAALSDMAMHFGTDPDALRGMLEKWVAKGRVVKLSSGTACSGGCSQCHPNTIEIYEWRN